MSAPVLRPYQSEGIDAAAKARGEGVRRILICAPTGAGKTVVGASIIHRATARGSRVVFVAHRRELISQSHEKVIDSGVPEADVGIIQAGSPARPNAPIQICSVDTLRARQLLPPCNLLMVDEAHRSLAATYQWLIDQYPKATLIGLTATPARLDGRGLEDSYDRLIQISSPSQLIAEGFLVKPLVYSHPMGADMEGVHLTGGDFNLEEVEERVNKPKLLGAIVDHWLQHAASRQTVAFAVSVAHSQALSLEFQGRGVAAEHIDGSMRKQDRDAILARFKAGTTTVVCNVDVLVEGWDAPWAKVLISARPTMSLTRWLQMCGRVMRPYQGIGALILDHAGNAQRHGLPSQDRDWSLQGRKKRARNAAPAEAVEGSKICPRCYLTVESWVDACPGCDHVWLKPMVTVAEGELELVSEENAAAIVARLVQEKQRTHAGRVRLTAEIRTDYEKMLRACAYSGKNASVAANIFKRKYGGFPEGARALEERFFPGGRSMAAGLERA